MRTAVSFDYAGSELDLSSAPPEPIVAEGFTAFLAAHRGWRNTAIGVVGATAALNIALLAISAGF